MQASGPWSGVSAQAQIHPDCSVDVGRAARQHDARTAVPPTPGGGGRSNEVESSVDDRDPARLGIPNP